MRSAETTMNDLYTTEFFRSRETGSGASARHIVPLLVDLLAPASVVDVGCGTGTWLAVFQRHGVDDIVGIDGDYVPTDELHISPARFRAHDLTQPLCLGRSFDLVVSLEVAEHLPPESATGFVDSLCGLGPVVLFS